MNILYYVQRRVWDPLLLLLRQGTSPAQLAWSSSLGAYLGVIPMLGVTTLLCTVVALPLRLNLVAIQAVNWLVYPLQVLLIIPFFRAGAWLFREPPMDLSPADLVALFNENFWGAVQSLWTTTWHALVVWLLIGLPIVAVSTLLLSALFSRLSHRMKKLKPATGNHVA
jgi:uncharacterized protein (DUF2062 family)